MPRTLTKPPAYTEKQFQQLAHERSQRGVSCWLEGRCQLYNSYLYDAKIIPRVKKSIDASNQFKDTNVWALGQRRIVWLKGCVRSKEQALTMEALIRSIDDMQGVQNELMVGIYERTWYEVRQP